jgi:lincosamide nucleotidyltransferase B/F
VGGPDRPRRALLRQRVRQRDGDLLRESFRGEFHFDKASDIQSIDNSWKKTDWFPSPEATLVLDRTGELSRRLQKIVGPTLDRHKPEQIRVLRNCFVNWFLFDSNLLMRSEVAWSLDLLGIVQDQLLRMIRVSEYSTEHWFNPSKLLEKDISEASYARYVTCTAELDRVLSRLPEATGVTSARRAQPCHN